MTLEHYLLLYEISQYLSGAIVMLSFIFFKRRSMEVKLMGLHNVNSILAGMVTYVFPIKGQQVNVIQASWFIVAFSIVAGIFYQGYNRRYGKTLFVIATALTLLAILNVLFLQKKNMNTYTSMTYTAFVSVLAIVYFYRLLADLPVKQVQQLPMFYFSAAFLIYSGATFFLYVATNYLVKFFYDDVLIYYIFHNYVLLLQLSIFIVGLLVDLTNMYKARTQSV